MPPTETSRMKLKINALTNTYAKAKRTIAMLTADLEETSLRLRVLFCVCVCVWERERERQRERERERERARVRE